MVRIKLTNRDLSLNVLAMFVSGSSISFVDKSALNKLQLQRRKASLSVAGIHDSQDVKIEIVPITVSAHEKSRLINSATVAKSSAQETTCSFPAEQRKYWKIHRWINGDTS